ncbi:MAG: Re/Si-specific NAD(P)(+) transhydrogenase subunit alpha [bacterium]|nr:Re/Si-specific NAD(P)(+) transhydrogenase subunit alpha [bacterium]MDW8086995.1 Re/Si-specific NAD(P)(+) transhydrogenase subunit alpha [Candidatus Calescibacterium sp.]
MRMDKINTKVMITVGTARELFPEEVRVAITPASAEFLLKKGFKVVVQSGCGIASGIKDQDYQSKGVEVVQRREEVFDKADFILYVRGPGSSREVEESDLKLLREGKSLIGFLEPLAFPEVSKKLAEMKVNAFSVELIPRISRAQSMDALSMMATVAGYRAVIEAAKLSDKMFPMLMTSAGTTKPAKVFVIGAGVAGLQAMAMSKKLGAIVEGYDIRPETKEQVQSVGAKFVELGLETEETRAEGGYAKAMGEEFYRKQRELMKKHVSEADVVITTAQVPGKRAPVLITKDMVESMRPSSVIIDIAAEKGGNCELTQAGKVVDYNGVKIFGVVNPGSAYPTHSSYLYSMCLANFLALFITKDGKFVVNFEDEIIRDSAVCYDGKIVSPMVRKILDGSAK